MNYSRGLESLNIHNYPSASRASLKFSLLLYLPIKKTNKKQWSSVRDSYIKELTMVILVIQLDLVEKALIYEGNQTQVKGVV